MMKIIALVGFSLALCAPPVGFAKDLPRIPPAPRSTGCEWAGPGFAKVEGGTTCVKIGGSVRAEFSASSRGSAFSTKFGQ